MFCLMQNLHLCAQPYSHNVRGSKEDEAVINSRSSRSVAGDLEGEVRIGRFEVKTRHDTKCLAVRKVKTLTDGEAVTHELSKRVGFSSAHRPCALCCVIPI